jgi:hypothetical protein
MPFSGDLTETKTQLRFMLFLVKESIVLTRITRFEPYDDSKNLLNRVIKLIVEKRIERKICAIVRSIY